MKSDDQVRLPFRLVNQDALPILTAAANAGMSETTACRYLRSERLPSELRLPPYWRTREDPFADVWEEATKMLTEKPDLTVKALFGELQKQHPGHFKSGQLRTLQRRVKQWRAGEID